MIPVSARDGGEAASTTEDRAEGRLAALARDLVDKVGIDGAIRYCRSLGWRGVLDQVENLRSQRS
ncbi:MAG: hypothetical protein ACFCUT_04565 [Kiloniellaceae bacterium]